MEVSGNRDSASWGERAKQTKSYSQSPLVESATSLYVCGALVILACICAFEAVAITVIRENQ